MSLSERKKRHTENLCESILQAALKIARKEGWNAVSTRKVAEEIEYSTTAIYHYFGNKDAILLELQKEGFSLLIKDFEKKIKHYKTSSERLVQISMGYFEFYKKNPELYQLMFNLGISSKEKPFELIKQLKKLVLLTLFDLSSVESEELFLNWWAIVHGFAAISLTSLFVCDDKQTDNMLESSVLRFMYSLPAKK